VTRKTYNFKEESQAMSICRKLGLDRLAWPLRRLHCPVTKEALVLEVGSGGNPYYRSNVLLDAYEETRHRHWAPLITDRPTVLGFVENLPFKDKVFDFVIASHVLEHSADPARFLNELQRVAKAGYIESPDAFMERVNPYLDHRLEITERDHKLLIRKKKSWQVDPELVELYEHRAKQIFTSQFIPSHPFTFHIRYYWHDHIDFVVDNPDLDAGWPSPTRVVPSLAHKSVKQEINNAILRLVRTLLSQRSRNRKIDLLSLLVCPACGSDQLVSNRSLIRCAKCSDEYSIADGIPKMIPSQGNQYKA
jgi:uncharacterized protein YbaR (Trm112 family)/SAM-dependent methyltransferase